MAVMFVRVFADGVSAYSYSVSNKSALLLALSQADAILSLLTWWKEKLTLLTVRVAPT